MTSYQTKIKDELRRIQDGPGIAEKPQGLGTVEFTVTCSGNSWKVLTKVKEVLRIISSTCYNKLPLDNEWFKILPDWFIAQCVPEMSSEQIEEWLVWWRKLSNEEQIKADREKKWSLLDWVYWFEEDNRVWFWWDAIEKSPNLLLVYVEVREWPFPWGALRWLFKAAGAIDVESKDD